MSMLVGLFSGLMNLFAGTLIGSVVIYVGVPLGAEPMTMSGERALVTAAVGAIVGVLVGGLFGWIPVVGALLAVAAWVGAVGYFTSATPSIAVGVGLVAWAVTLVVTTGITTLIFGVR